MSAYENTGALVYIVGIWKQVYDDGEVQKDAKYESDEAEETHYKKCVEFSVLKKKMKMQMDTKIRKGDGLKPGCVLMRRLGKGANNLVILCRSEDGHVVVRRPRRNSDTQDKDSARVEYELTQLAADLGIGPLVYDAWYVKRATRLQNKGLHLVNEYFPMDLHTCLMKRRLVVDFEDLREQIVAHIRKMAENELLSYDLKMANIVLSLHPKLAVRFIDFGQDFCEKESVCVETPQLNYIKSLGDDTKQILFFVMLIILSANVGYVLDHYRHDFSVSERMRMHILHDELQMYRRALPNTKVELIHKVLRFGEIKRTIRHYIGRHNAGVKRVCRMSGFKLYP